MNVKRSEGYLDELSVNLINNSVGKYYTCHCTGEEAYSYLSRRVGNLNEIKNHNWARKFYK
jgi:7,8-dihydropterin-6-yl-methyl-4-(beta-D-ribofuranosyl)aminobenzene 5'-phosphate synthase